MMDEVKKTNPDITDHRSSIIDSSPITARDGRPLRDVVGVAASCPAGHPAVVTSYPLRREGERVVPFPTLYWLTCPRLCEQVSHLERDGVIAVLEAELLRNEELRAGLRRNHETYISQRWAALTPADRLLVAEHGLLDTFLTRGIGGIGNQAGVKCLHLHLAHHLASGNVIGEWLMERYGVRCCGDG